MSTDDGDLDKLIARTDFYLSCVDQLRKELPRYLGKQIAVDKAHKSFSIVLRSVASSEPNQKLQDFVFAYADAQELIEKEGEAFTECDKHSHDILEESKKLLILPMIEIVSDHKALSKDKKKKADKKKLKKEIADSVFVKSSLPVHVKMFEKHRVQHMKQLFSTVVRTELRYHCRAIEELSQVLRSLAQLDVEELSPCIDSNAVINNPEITPDNSNYLSNS